MQHACAALLTVCCESAHAAQAPPPAKRAKVSESVADKRDPKLPTSVPMPKDVSEINNVHVATLLADGAATQPAAAGAAVPAAGKCGAAAFLSLLQPHTHSELIVSPTRADRTVEVGGPIDGWGWGRSPQPISKGV